MGAEIVNLRQARKRKRRAEEERTAGHNRLAYGRTKSEKSASRAVEEMAKARHEAGRIEKTSRPNSSRTDD